MLSGSERQVTPGARPPLGPTAGPRGGVPGQSGGKTVSAARGREPAGPSGARLQGRCHRVGRQVARGCAETLCFTFLERNL